MKFSVKKGDYVKIIAGNDKGKFGQVVAVNRDTKRVTVEGKDLSVVKKAVRARKANDKAGIIELPKSMDISNVMPVCASCGMATRVRHGEVDGKKVRICAKCGAVLETKKKKEEKKKATVRRKKKDETAAAVAPEAKTEAVAQEVVAEEVKEVKTTVTRRKKTETTATVAEAPAKKTTTRKKKTAEVKAEDAE